MEEASYYAKISKDNKAPAEHLLSALDDKIIKAAKSGMTSIKLRMWSMCEIKACEGQKTIQQQRTNELVLYKLVFYNQEYFRNLGFTIEVLYADGPLFVDDDRIIISWS